MKARSVIEAESPKAIFKQVAKEPYQFKKRVLTPREIDRLARIIAMGPLDRKPFDQRFFDWGYVEAYDDMPGTVEAKAGFAQAFYNKNGSVGDEWMEPSQWRGRVRQYYWREGEDPKGVFKSLSRADALRGTFEVRSSGGLFYVHPISGKVIRWEPDSEDDADFSGYGNIDRFDVLEWGRHYNWTAPDLPRSIDILDLGFWTKNGTYEPPDHEWRQLRHECFSGHLANPESADGSVSKTVNLGGASPPVPTNLTG